MGQKIISTVAPELVQLRRRFEAWRRTGRKGRRIPDELWAQAVDLAREQGVYRIARSLRLEYNGLKRRVNAEGHQVKESLPSVGGSSFIELGVESVVGMPTCAMELASRRGKLTIRLTGYKACDVMALANTLVDAAR